MADLVPGARHVVVPSNIDSTAWPSVRDTAKRLGVIFDPWQEGLSQLALSKRPDGVYACAEGAVVVSIPRQVGKTYWASALAFSLGLLKPGSTAIWTAHHMATAGETFAAMQAFSKLPLVAPHVEKVLTDDQIVLLENGSRILFGSRDRGFGRGFTSVDLLFFDEAQILTEKSLTSMAPSTAVVQNALVFLFGTPPGPDDPSEVFSSRRKDALSGESEDLVYVEFSADVGADLDDERQWRKANPSFPKRTPASSIRRMLRLLPPGSFRREILGIWDEAVEEEAPHVIPPERWAAVVGEMPDGGTPVYGVKFSADGASVGLAGAVMNDAGGVFVEAIDHRLTAEGTAWLVDWLAQRGDRVVVDGLAGVGALIAALRREGVPAARLRRPTVDDVVTAHAEFVEAVLVGSLSHSGDPAMAVDHVVRRPIGKQGGWGFVGRDGEDVSLLEAAALAHWGVKHMRGVSQGAGRVVRGRRVSTGRRKAVVM